MKPNKLILFSLILFILVFGCNAPASLATTSNRTCLNGRPA